MPRFFLYFRDGGASVGDEEGFEFPDAAAARDEAIKAAREAVAQRIIRNEIVDGEFFDITDTSGALVGRVTLKEVIRLDENIG